MHSSTLSVVVITRNERSNIARCLKSVTFADEIIVLDYDSTDGTVDIARGLGAQVFQTKEWPGFGVQKNLALSHATCDWVMSLDADEWISPALATEIQDVISMKVQEDRDYVYAMPRKSAFCGQFMQYGGWYPDYVTRLFPRGEACFTDDWVHESLHTQKAIKNLKSDLLHNSTPTIESSLDKINRYSTGRAMDLNRKGRRGSLSSALLHGFWAFFRCYFLRMGVLDGRMGFLLALANAEGTFYRYIKLWVMQRQVKSDTKEWL